MHAGTAWASSIGVSEPLEQCFSDHGQCWKAEIKAQEQAEIILADHVECLHFSFSLPLQSYHWPCTWPSATSGGLMCEATQLKYIELLAWSCAAITCRREAETSGGTRPRCWLGVICFRPVNTNSRVSLNAALLSTNRRAVQSTPILRKERKL